MTHRTRRKIDAALKAKIALEALREHMRRWPIWRSAFRCTRTKVAPGRSSFWIRRRGIRESGSGHGAAGHARELKKLHAKFGQLIIERDFFSEEVRK
ncbi:hypothetical protein EAS62_39745 [Bradyrhizobium zhanjiangense]|uniref:Uncharacterized protein n=1 Tax=Bradyrhizobium zhanjiangense TaxID=1325107 RepID=A0ABY0D880_9BRAD|nr:hypothetical protein EAS62_39745 [Bradyrhizobium zhanjiangense]